MGFYQKNIEWTAPRGPNFEVWKSSSVVIARFDSMMPPWPCAEQPPRLVSQGGVDWMDCPSGALLLHAEVTGIIGNQILDGNDSNNFIILCYCQMADFVIVHVNIGLFNR